jgi:diguanylate cyclase (GGDEF)-like protein/putative nucleotidyltransferase with HDIG domain
MSALASLSELARLATLEEDTAAAVSSALRIVEAELGARAAFLVYGGEDDFHYFDEMAPLELSRTALWLINRELTSRVGPVAFRVKYGRVTEFGGIDEPRPHDYIAAIMPATFITANMLIVQGSWSDGHSATRRDFLAAAAPLLSQLLLRRLKIAQAESDQIQLNTLFSVGRVISQTEELPSMLMRMAGSVASLVSANPAVIDVFGRDGIVRLRCVSQEIPAASPWIERWTRAAQRPDPVRNIVVATRQPMIFEDAQNDERIPERGRAFFTSTLIRSTAVFPLVTGDDVIGVLSLASARPTRFEGRQRELIEAAAGQIAAAVQGVLLYEDRREAEAALRRSQDLLTATIESTADGILAVDAEGRVTYANRRFAEMWRIPDAILAEGSDQQLIEFAMSQLTDPEAWVERIRALYACTEEDLGILSFKDGRVFERYSRALMHGDGPAGRVWSFRDVTERHRTEQLLIDQARRDSLTNLLNHAAIEDALRECAGTATSVAATSVAVVVVDVDGMKAVNDTYGHVAGDQVLTTVAAKLRRDDAHVGRYGGDEFIVVLPDVQRPEAEQYCRDVMTSLAHAGVRDATSGSGVPVAVSMGLTVWPTEVRFIEDAIRVADEAMYSEKRERAIAAEASGMRKALADDRAARMIGEIVPLLTSSARLDEKLRLVAGRLADGAGYAAVRFALDHEVASAGKQTVTHVNGVRNPRDETFSDEVSAVVRSTRRPVFIEDLTTDPRVPSSHREVAIRTGLGPGLVVPLVSQDAVVGFLSVASSPGSPLDARDARFLAAVAEQVMAIARMEALVGDLETSASRLQDARADTVMMLAAAAEAHDATTGRHLARVRTLSELLARELGMPDAEVNALGLAATLHDIGKIRVPESILMSPARLNGEEWTVMKQHTQWGAEFLRQRSGFELAAIIAQHHHERWDGSGYPARLAGKAIPEAAAIVTVADSLDAITNDRPYRLGRPLHWAIGEIVRCSGQQFSPRVVEALLRLYRKRALDFLTTESEDVLRAA